MFRPSGIAIVAIAFFSTNLANAAAPGDPCSVAGGYTRSTDSAAAYHLVCDGSQWNLNLTLHKDGPVGIGTVSPSSGLTLDVEGKVGATEYCDENGNNCFTADGVGGGSAVASGPDRSIQFNDSAAFAGDASFVFTGEGRVGIGTNSPEKMLTISSAGNSFVQIQDTINGSAHNVSQANAGINFTTNDGDYSGTKPIVHSRIYTIPDNIYGSGFSMRFATGNSTAPNQDRMVIASTGGIGIGLTNPPSTSRLTIKTATNGTDTSGIEISNSSSQNILTARSDGLVSISGYNATNGVLEIWRNVTGHTIENALFLIRNSQGGSGGVGLGSRLIFRGETTTDGTLENIAGIAGAWEGATAGAGNGYLEFGTVTNGSYTEKVRIDAAGRVGIGKSAPVYALDVVGDIAFTGDILDVSDRRLKDNIESLPAGQLEKLMALQGVSFTMQGSEKTELGLIAQDVEPHYPDLVQTRPDGTKTMSYLGFIAPLIEALKEQQSQIDTLQQQIELLQSQQGEAGSGPAAEE